MQPNSLPGVPKLRTSLDATYNGKALITSQYRNSYFLSYYNNPNAIIYHDGWLINRKGSYSFYGIIGKDKIISYINLVGLSVEEMFFQNGSVFVLAKKPMNI